MFYQGDLQSGIASAVQQQKAVLCLVHDSSETSDKWEALLSESDIKEAVEDQTVSLKLAAGSQEAGFLTGFCPVDSSPAMIVIRQGQIELNVQGTSNALEDLRTQLQKLLGVPGSAKSSSASHPSPAQEDQPFNSHRPSTENDTQTSLDSASSMGYLNQQPSSKRFRLSNNAYDALRTRTQELVGQGRPPHQILDTQLSLLERLPIFKDEVNRIRSQNPTAVLSLSETAVDRLLRLPAAAIQAQPKLAPSNSQPISHQAPPPTSPPSTPGTSSPPQTHQPSTMEKGKQREVEAPTEDDKQQIQRDDYIKMQREREQKQRGERERIKAQIKADREERRHQEAIRKQNEAAAAAEQTSADSAQPAQPRTNQTRVQVRTFDGSTLRRTFAPSSTIACDIRPWIDSTTGSTAPYNLKLILTPLPNRNIEAPEEEQPLSDLGIRGSCTFVMVPVKGYVESYTGSTSTGLVGSAISGGYNLVTGTAGALFGGAKWVLGYGGGQSQSEEAPPASAPPGQAATTASSRNTRVRTLADQRADEAGRNQQFYNGNALNFQPNREDDEGRKND